GLSSTSRMTRERLIVAALAYRGLAHTDREGAVSILGQRALDAPVLRLLVLRRGPDVDVIDPPLVVFLAQHDPVADALLVPAQLGAIVAFVVGTADVLADSGDEALDLADEPVAAALGECRERPGDVARGDCVGEHAHRI